ncbi:MAG TPA: nickel pincer cofactor biosynthesis protein LarC [Gemmatimonadaceae bacterium]|nr:nickel pincer cofactor biosynthesis protein LarC [Gemmatimonadaceae bacterium]
MPIAILDPFSGISGDMTLGALVEVGLDPDWLRALPARLGLDGVDVRIQRVLRSEIVCTKVDFDIPPQPHGRGLAEIRELVQRASLPDGVRARADAAFLAIAEAEGEIHGIPPERVHLHEVGAVDAILDVVGAVWGFAMLGVERIHCGTVALGDGSVRAAHGVLPVPAPATLKLLEGHPVRPGPEGAGELVTPTGAALVRVLSVGPPPAEYVPLRSGFGAGTKDPRGRPNALRVVLAEAAARDGVRVDALVLLATDVDDMDGEQLGALAEILRREGALDVVLLPTLMKKGRPGTRIEVLCEPAGARHLEQALFTHGSTIGVRRTSVERDALPREEDVVCVLDHEIRVKVVTLPSGARRAKPEHDDVARVAALTGRALREVAAAARDAAERMVMARVSRPAG